MIVRMIVPMVVQMIVRMIGQQMEDLALLELGLGSVEFDYRNLVLGM